MESSGSDYRSIYDDSRSTFATISAPQPTRESLRIMQEMMMNQAGSIGNIMPFQSEDGPASATQIKESQEVFAELKSSGVKVEVKENQNRSKQLEELGLTKLANEAKKVEAKIIKESMIGIAGYLRITKAKVDELNARLGKVSKRLKLTQLADYKQGVPPADVLEKLGNAQKAGVFDSFEIFTIEKVPDPVLVGRIAESEDYFFVAEWGDDVSLKDFLG